MASSQPCLLRALALVSFLAVSSTATPMIQNIDITGGKPTIRSGGSVVDLRLDQASASGFQSKQEYLFSRIDMQNKLPAENSAGTVTTFYVSPLSLTNGDSNHTEIDCDDSPSEPTQVAHLLACHSPPRAPLCSCTMPPLYPWSFTQVIVFTHSVSPSTPARCPNSTHEASREIFLS
ncbi:unnamed protein product [Victoria cruziana]